QAAESEATDQSAILVATGEALLTLGDRDAAMERFTRALEAPDANRVDVRLEFAKLFVQEGKYDSAKQEVGLAFAEARIGEASPITTDNLVEAANVFLAAHEFALAERYYQKARAMGASDDSVAIGLADVYVAEGKDREAEAVLASLGDPAAYKTSYDYELAWGNIYNQRHDNVQALSAFARANQIASEDATAQHAMLDVAGREGTQILPSLNMRNDLATGAVFEDATLYQMDDQFFGAPPPPRYSQETVIGSTFHYHHQGWGPINGFFGLRNFKGSLFLPSELAIVKWKPLDIIFYAGVPTTL